MLKQNQLSQLTMYGVFTVLILIEMALRINWAMTIGGFCSFTLVGNSIPVDNFESIEKNQV